ncbi:MAG: ribosome small subunit-dependent GTPase A [Anaerolineales bacterium]|nr:ribosome small subunit-dependent GTPase A [Anaerolineales bacterium]
MPDQTTQSTSGESSSPDSPPTVRGLVIRAQSGFYTIDTDQGQRVAQLRGRLKRGPATEDLVAIGDWVEISLLDEEKAVIESVEERTREIIRSAPDARGDYRQVIVANPDQIVLVFSLANPAPRLGMLDRYLVIAEEQDVPAWIIANKIDLVTEQEARSLFDPYATIGYPTLYTSAETGVGLGEFKAGLQGKISALTGPSGVGKTSLLNAIQPGLGLDVSHVSRATDKGRHTTVVRQMLPLEGGGYVADTPGLKQLSLWDIEAEELDGYFREIRPLVADCQFRDCSHIEEPGCAVREAVEVGDIDPRRYDSYVRMRLGQVED